MPCKLSALLALILLYSTPLRAEQRDITIEDKSTSGRTIRLTAGQQDGLHLREAVLIRQGDTKLVAARVIALQPTSSAVYIVENYAPSTQLPKGQQFNILYGVPLGDIPDLPDNVADTLQNNPQDEQFFAGKTEKDSTPDLDDEGYQPETILRPKFPEKRYNTAHHLSLGVEIFRNANLASSTSGGSSYTTYQGYALRYQYNWRSSMWLKEKVPIWIGAEIGTGTYTFNQGYPDGRTAHITVFPVNANIKFIWEFNKFLRGYPYLGVQNNIVQSKVGDPSTITKSTPTVTDSTRHIEDLQGARLMLGLGASMIMSEDIDVRVDGGIDGGLLAAVVKF